MYVDNTRAARRGATRAGFTLIELIITLAIGVVLLSLVAPAGVSFYQRVLAEDVAEETILVLREASNDARRGRNDIAHGVFFGTTSLTHLQGASYATRIVSADYVVTMPSAVTRIGLSDEVVFGAHTGMPSIAGILTLTLYENAHMIDINPLGHVWGITALPSQIP